MKKYTFILAVGVMLTLAACGKGSTTNEEKDSTAVVSSAVNVDSTAAPAVDSTQTK